MLTRTSLNADNFHTVWVNNVGPNNFHTVWVNNVGPNKAQFPKVVFRVINWRNAISKHFELQDLNISVTNLEQFHAMQCYKKNNGSSPTEVFFREDVLKMWNKFTGELPWRGVISIKLLCNVIEIALSHGCSPVICCMFSEHLFIKTPLEGFFWNKKFYVARICSFYQTFQYQSTHYLVPMFPAYDLLSFLAQPIPCNKCSILDQQLVIFNYVSSFHTRSKIHFFKKVYYDIVPSPKFWLVKIPTLNSLIVDSKDSLLGYSYDIDNVKPIMKIN